MKLFIYKKEEMIKHLESYLMLISYVAISIYALCIGWPTMVNVIMVACCMLEIMIINHPDNQ